MSKKIIYTDMAQEERVMYADLFRRYGSLSDCADEKLYFYGQRPDTIETPDRIVSADKSAADFLNRLEKLKKQVMLYRKELTGRYNELVTAAYVPGVKLTRERRYSDNLVKYRITYFIRYIDSGEEVRQSEDVFSGTDRGKAIKAYNDYVGKHPGIICSMDIAKKNWER